MSTLYVRIPEQGSSFITEVANTATLTLSVTDGVLTGDVVSGSLAEYALLAGRAGGQILNGGTAASENLTLDSTANATKGIIYINAGSRLVVDTVPTGLTDQLIVARNNTSNIVSARAGDTSTFAPGMRVARARNTLASPNAVQSGDVLGQYFGAGYNGSTYSNTASVAFFARETFSGSARGTDIAFNTVQLAATTSRERLRITAEGRLRFSTSSPSGTHDLDWAVDGDGSIGGVTDNRPATVNVLTSLGVGLSASQQATSILQLDSTAKGVLLPRMTTAQRDAIVSPATNLLIVNTDTDSVDMWDGAEWAQLQPTYAELDDGLGGTAKTIDFAKYKAHTLELDDDCTVTLSNLGSGQAGVLRVVQDSTPRTITWVTVNWGDAGAPDLSSLTTGQMAIINLYSDGAALYGSYRLGF